MSFFESSKVKGLSMRVFAATTGLLCLLSTLFAAPAKTATTGEHWVATWSASVIARSQTSPPPNNQNATATPQPPPIISLSNQTIRQIVHTSIGGDRVRVVLTNALGTAPLKIGAVHLSRRLKGAQIDTNSDRIVTFSDRPSVTIPAGAVIISDPVKEAVPTLGDLVVDLYVPTDAIPETSPLTVHNLSFQTNYVSRPGNFAGAPDLPESKPTMSWFFLARVEVTAPQQVGAIVAFGDSISEGYRSTPDTNNRWPDHLAKRLADLSGRSLKLAVVNAGISGNRLLSEGSPTVGVNALARMDRDALAEAGATYMIALLGINDIGAARQNSVPGAEDLIAAHEQLVERAHARGLKVFVGTLTPFEGAAYFTPEGETKRQAVNNWIRTNKAYDGVIDFDAVVRDREHPTKFLSSFDCGDHLHPNDSGYAAMANAIDLSLFDSGRREKTSK